MQCLGTIHKTAENLYHFKMIKAPRKNVFVFPPKSYVFFLKDALKCMETHYMSRNRNRNHNSNIFNKH